MSIPDFDEIGEWSEVKLEILRKYAQAYSQVLSSRRSPAFDHVYIDAFSGSGTHLRKATGEEIAGSPRIALEIQPAFRRYYFVDLDGDKLEFLRRTIGVRPNVEVLQGDCNEILLERVFPRVAFDRYERGLCLLDPYGLTLSWEVIAAAAAARSIEIFLNFPVMDINRNALWHDRDRVPGVLRDRLTRFWGDESWREQSYELKLAPQLGLWKTEDKLVKASNAHVAELFRRRLREVAGFNFVPEPVAMRNDQNAIVYYLYFASQNPVGAEIVEDIFRRYRR